MGNESPNGPGVPAAVQENIGFLLAWLQRKQRQVFIEDLEPHDLRPAYYGVLVLLEDRQSASQQRLGEWLGIDRSNMVALIDDLERRGLVERAPDPTDRRRHAVRLTEAGRAAVGELHAAATRLSEHLLAPLTVEERQTLAALLTRLLTPLLQP
jgi:DNA-binding MarR family transcriptional regulator